jgi:hypothetical protein
MYLPEYSSRPRPSIRTLVLPGKGMVPATQDSRNP